uniref:Uncharacterized protein n=1 Tax=Picea sitchensis TaxID=3332 RepID=D5A8G4_PICSI|nr:unknown [Picea sitchensis]
MSKRHCHSSSGDDLHRACVSSNPCYQPLVILGNITLKFSFSTGTMDYTPERL